jgi:enoyl-CoA hydratase/carnithine racemase
VRGTATLAGAPTDPPQTRRQPEHDYEEMKKAAEPFIQFEKTPRTGSPTFTFDRPDELNCTTMGMRQNYADLIHKCNVDDDVKVVVIRGEGEDFGSGGVCPNSGTCWRTPECPLHGRTFDQRRECPARRLLPLPVPMTVTTPRRARVTVRCRVQEGHHRQSQGCCYGWHFYQAGDADLVVSSDDALFGHPAFRYVGWGPRLWWWAGREATQVLEMLFTGRPFTRRRCTSAASTVVPREDLEAETLKYAMACSKTRPTDTVVVQKMFLELYKQHKGEYFGSLLTGVVEGMLPMMTTAPMTST